MDAAMGSLYVEDTMAGLRKVCILQGNEEEIIRQGLVEMFEAGYWGVKDEEVGDDALVGLPEELTAVERLAERVMMRIRKGCYLGIGCQAAVKLALLEAFAAGGAG